MIHFIEIHWTRRHPQPGNAASGVSTFAIGARYAAAARSHARTKFLRRFGRHLAIDRIDSRPGEPETRS